MDLHAELPGYVLQKSAVHGMRVTPADILFDIADLSEVWILADVYESDLATVELGMAARGRRCPYQPGRTWRGKVAFVNPIVEPGTRTVKVRIEVANGDYALKPDMFADVVLRRELGDALFVPESAVLKPGERQLVFLDRRGRATRAARDRDRRARRGRLRRRSPGLAEGDKVVTSANFLIDSESSLKAALSSMAAAPGATPHPGHVQGAPAPSPKAALPQPPGHEHPEAAMTRAIIKWSAENRWVVLLATAAVVLFAVYVLRTIPVDAIPDLSDTQVIVYSRWDRSPDIVEDQVTYPIVTALLGAPRVKTIRGFSDFGFSYVYVIFEDGTDIYWARSRVVEYLSKIQRRLPEGVRTELGPDATGVGWVFQYALVDDSGKHNLADLRTFQDWTLRYRLQSVPGVAEVATFGGFQQQYQVTVDPNRLKAYGLGIMEVTEAVRRANVEVGGRLVEMSGKEYMVRGRGYVRSTADLEKIVLRVDPLGTPVLLRDVGEVALGPEIRRGVGDLDGRGDAVGGIVVMRHGENARAVIERVRERLREIEPSLPEGVRDRHDLRPLGPDPAGDRHPEARAACCRC